MAQISITDGSEFLSDTIPTDTAEIASRAAPKKSFCEEIPTPTKPAMALAITDVASSLIPVPSA
jgi:hypothetical protein